MQRDLGITMLRFHFSDGRPAVFSGEYFTCPSWFPGLLWGAWRYLANDNGKGEVRCFKGYSGPS